jgi:hypothetical protein
MNNIDIEDAYRIVNAHGNAQGIRGLFMILQDMENCWAELNNQERTAYRIIKKDMYATMGDNL